MHQSQKICKQLPFRRHPTPQDRSTQLLISDFVISAHWTSRKRPGGSGIRQHDTASCKISELIRFTAQNYASGSLYCAVPCNYRAMQPKAGAYRRICGLQICAAKTAVCTDQPGLGTYFLFYPILRAHRMRKDQFFTAFPK